MNWEDILKKAREHEHKGKDGVPSASALNYTCGMYQSSPSGEAAIMGTAEHLLQQMDYCPLDAPGDVVERFSYAQMAVEYLKGDMEVYGMEIYMEAADPALTGSADLILCDHYTMEDVLVIDYKFGQVLVFSNCGQGTGYAWLVFNKIPKAKRVKFAIVQPKLNKNFEDISSKVWEKDDALAYVNHWHLKYNKIAIPNGKDCQYCMKLGSKDCQETLKLLEEF